MGLYFGGTLLFLAFLLHRSDLLVKGAVFVTGAGFLVHTTALGMAVLGTGQGPIMTFRDAMSFFAWGLVLVFLVVGLKRGLQVLGAFILPLAFLS